MTLISAKDLFTALTEGFLVLWPMWLLIGVAVALKFAFRLWQKQRLSKSGITEIDLMDGQTFEKYLEALFEKLNYRVERT